MASSIAWMLLRRTTSIGPSDRFGGTTLTSTRPASGAVDAATELGVLSQARQHADAEQDHEERHTDEKTPARS